MHTIKHYGKVPFYPDELLSWYANSVPGSNNTSVVLIGDDQNGQYSTLVWMCLQGTIIREILIICNPVDVYK